MSHLKGLALVRGFDLVDQPFLGSFGEGTPPRPRPAETDTPPPRVPGVGSGGAVGEDPIPPPPEGRGEEQLSGGVSETGPAQTQAERAQQDDLNWLWADDDGEER